jgi:hypothetical protein
MADTLGVIPVPLNQHIHDPGIVETWTY